MTTLTSCYSNLNNLYDGLFKKHGPALQKKSINYTKEVNGHKPRIRKDYLIGIINKLKQVLAILEYFQDENRQEVYSYLYSFNKVLKLAIELRCPSGAHENIVKLYEKVASEVKKSKKFLNNYSYQTGKNYLANTAILLAAMLYQSAQAARNPNIEADIDILEDTSQNEEYSLERIASKIRTATKITARNIQFIALGVSNDDKVWVTTNYHTPMVFPLDSFFSTKNYKIIKRAKDKFNKANPKNKVNFVPRIHAETMMASLRDVLEIRDIFVVDGTGKKVENCPCCSQYLCTKGFTSESHMERVQNYEIPKKNHVQNVKLWAQYLENKNLFHQIPFSPLYADLEEASDAAVNTANKLLKTVSSIFPYHFSRASVPSVEDIFNFIKVYYPYELDKINGLYDTYHHAKRLSAPDDKEIERTIIRQGKSTGRYLNKRFCIFDDNRLQTPSQISNRLEPICPDSPRSKRLSKMANTWLEVSDSSVDFVVRNKDQVILGRRS